MKKSSAKNDAITLDYDYLSKIRRAVALYTARKTSNILEGDFHSIFHGRSMEFEDLKEYAYGDDVHDIDWKSSSRSGKILIRRYEAERKHNVLFIMDTGRKMDADTMAGEDKAHLALMLFGTIAYIASRDSADFALANSTAEGIELSGFRSGPGHLEALLYNLKKTITQDPKYSLSELCHRVTDTLSRKTMLFIITDIGGMETLDDQILHEISLNHDLFLFNLQDAFLSQDNTYDTTLGHYVPAFLTGSRRLREAEKQDRAIIQNRIHESLRRYQGAMMDVIQEERIIDALILLLERKRHGIFG
jgi:uncharacterized protein (DUF58 family)